LPQPPRQRRDGVRVACRDDLDPPIRQILDPTSHTELDCPLGGRGPKVHALHVARDEAANYTGALRHVD
jgi:hypothetical protein